MVRFVLLSLNSAAHLCLSAFLSSGQKLCWPLKNKQIQYKMLKSSSSTLLMLNVLSLPPETSLCVQVMLQLLSWGNQLWPKEKQCPNLILLRSFGDTAVICDMRLKVSCVLWLCSPGRDNSEHWRPLELCLSRVQHREGCVYEFHSSVMPPKTIPSFLEIPCGIREYEAFFLPASLPGSSFLFLKCLKQGERLFCVSFLQKWLKPMSRTFLCMILQVEPQPLLINTVNLSNMLLVQKCYDKTTLPSPGGDSHFALLYHQK